MVCEEDPRVSSFYVERRETTRAMLALSYVPNTTLSSLSKQPKRRRSIQLDDEEDEPEPEPIASGSGPVKKRRCGADARLLAEMGLVVLPRVDNDLNSSRSSRSKSRSRSRSGSAMSE